MDQKFEMKLFQKLRHDERYHINEIINSLRIAKALMQDEINFAFLAPMQSGKTGTIKHLSELILPAIGYLQDDQSILFLTSMRDSDLKEQNIRSLESDSSNIFVLQMDKFKSIGLPFVNENKVKLIIRDEDQYGCGKESTFDFGFFQNVRNILPEIPLLSVSATPFDVLDARENGLPVKVVHGMRHDNYFGISEMLNGNMVYDLPEDYEHFKAQGDQTIISKELKSSILHLNKFDKGLGIIRCSNTNQALKIKEQFASLSKYNIETLVVGCKTEITDFSIKDGMRALARKFKAKNKKVILLVIHALSAGKDLKSLKQHIRFVIETRKTQVANCVQGLPGRVCGYHSNRDILIYANRDILEYYSDFENDPTIFNNKEWLDNLYFDEKVKSLTSQVRFGLTQREGVKAPILETIEVSVDELFNEEGERKLSFLDNEEYNNLIKYFDKGAYNNEYKVGGLKNKQIQLRVASNYKKTNTVYSGWSKGKGDNFKSLFSHKGLSANYGILISNYPKSDQRNLIKFCGLKVFISGDEKWCKNIMNTENNSMYEPEIRL